MNSLLSLKYILRPLSWLYGVILWIRHKFYDWGFFDSMEFSDLPLIRIGNLSLGGTGKTPFTVFLIEMYQAEPVSIFVVSRGYGRTTKECIRLTNTHNIFEVGDEPLLLKRKFPMVEIYVSHCRVEAIHEIIDFPTTKPKLIILDDAMQHRKLAGGFQVLLTSGKRPFWKDNLLPVGSLRDIKSRARFVDLNVLTKCTLSSLQERKVFRDNCLNAIRGFNRSPILYSSIQYDTPYDFFSNEEKMLESRVIALAGLANNTDFFDYVRTQSHMIESLSFRDHRIYTETEVKKWIERARSSQVQQIITTEKDAVRLILFQSIFIENNISLVVVPISMYFDQDERMALKAAIDMYISKVN